MEQSGADSWRKGPWTPQEDKLLIHYVTEYGEGRWSSVSKCTGLKRSGKSSRLRWVNYLRPGLKKGHLTPQEEGIIIELHALWGNRWSTIARYLPGRTDNEIKNYWRTHFKPRKASHAKQQNSKISNHKLQSHELENNSSITISESSPQESDCSKKEEEIEFVPVIENHQFLPAVYQETASDFIPQDCYLWGGLWNIDDDDQDQLANIANCYNPFEEYGFDFMQSSGEFLL